MSGAPGRPLVGLHSSASAPHSPPSSPPASPSRQTGRRQVRVPFKCDCSYLYPRKLALQVQEIPREVDIHLQQQSILEGNLAEVQLQIWEQLHEYVGQAGRPFRDWMSFQRSKLAHAGGDHSPFLFPFFLFTNLSDAPVTRHNLRVSLLGDEELGLSKATRLVCGPSSSFSALDVGTGGIPNPKHLEHEISDLTESVGRLYVCESIDNSLEALRHPRAPRESEPKLLHVYMMRNLDFLQAPPPFICTFDNGKGVNTKDELTKSFTYGLDPRAGIVRHVDNDGSVFGWADARLSSFGVGHQKAAFQRGRVLTAISRGEGSDTIFEGTIDLDDCIKKYNQGKQAESWIPSLEPRPMSGPSHEITSRKRGQAWEWEDLNIREIVRQASAHRSFFLEIVSRLKSKTLQHISEDSTVIYKELAHMYFFYTPLPQHFAPPFNVGYQYGPVEMHLHVAQRQPTETGIFKAAFEDFRLDSEPWQGWPLQDPTTEHHLHRECVPARLLRLVKTNSTFDQPLHLPKMGMDIRDTFVFGFSNQGMQGGGGCPIQLVKLHYLPNNGSMDLKEQLELRGYGRVKGLSASRLADIYFQGRLVPFAAVHEMHVLTKAVKGLRKERGIKWNKDLIKRTIETRIFGQIFLQGAGASGLVDDTKFYLGSVKLGLEDPTTCGDIATSYYAVKIHHGKQFFNSVTAEDVIQDLKLWFMKCEDTFERGYKPSDELIEQDMDELQRKCMVSRRGKYYKRLKRMIGAQPLFFAQGDQLYTRIPNPQVCPGKNRERTPVKVLGFFDPEDGGSPGMSMSIFVQLLPVECFGQKVQEYALDRFMTSFLEYDEDGARMDKFMKTLKNQPKSIQLVAKFPGVPLTENAPLQLTCRREEQTVKVQPKLQDLVVTQWLTPDYQFKGREDTQQSSKRASSHEYPLLDLEHEVRHMCRGETFMKPATLLGDHFESIIPASLLYSPGQLKERFILKHRGTVFSELDLDIVVGAGPPHSLRVLRQPECRIGEPFQLELECEDVCHNPVSFPSDSKFATKAIVRPEADLSVEVLQSLVAGHLANITVRLHGSMKSLAPSFGRSPKAPKTVKLDVEVQQETSGLKGKGALHILPGPPKSLVLAPNVVLDQELENGSHLQSASFIIEDAEGCPVNMDGDGCGGWIRIQGADLSVVLACSIDGCYITTPKVLVDAGIGLAGESELQIQVYLDRGWEHVQYTDSVMLLPSLKPRKVVLQLGQGPAIQQLNSDEEKTWSERADPKMLHEAKRDANDRGCTYPPAFLLLFPNASIDTPCSVEGLQLSLFSDRGPWGMDENDVDVRVHPNFSNQKFIVDRGQVSGFKAPGLEKQAHVYFVRCTREEVEGMLGFLFIIAAIEPPPTMWQWRSPEADTASASTSAAPEAQASHPRKRFRSASGALATAVTTEVGSVCSSASIDVLQPLSDKLCACVAADTGKAMRSASGLKPSLFLQPEPGSASTSIEFVRSSGSSIVHLGQGPVEWAPEQDLCLWGAAGEQCCLKIEGGGLQPAYLQATLAAGQPCGFTLHGLPGCPAIEPKQQYQMGQQQHQHQQQQQQQQEDRQDQQLHDAQSSYQWECHQDLNSLLVVLRDAYGNATDASPLASMCLSFECQNLSSFQVYPATLKLSPARLADSIQAFELVNRDACRIHAAPQAANLIAHLSIEQTGSNRVSLRKQLRVQFQASGDFIHAVRIYTLPALAQGLIAGAIQPSPIARLSLVTDTDEELTSADQLEELSSSLDAQLEGAAEACQIRADSSGLFVWLDSAPTAANLYNLKATYMEGRPGQASALLGSPALCLTSNSLVPVSVKAGSPSQLLEIMRHPAGEIHAGNSSSMPGITTHLLDSIELQLADEHGNAARPSTQEMTVCLSIQPAIPPAEADAATRVPNLEPYDARLNEEGRTIIRGIRIQEGSCIGLGAESAVFVLQASTNNITPYRLQFTFYDTLTRSLEEVQASQRAQQARIEQERLDHLRTMTAQKQSRQREIQSHLDSLEVECAQKLHDMQQVLLNSEIRHLPLAAQVLSVLRRAEQQGIAEQQGTAEQGSAEQQGAAEQGSAEQQEGVEQQGSAEQQGRATVQQISAAVASLQKEGCSAPQGTAETDRIRQCVLAFRNAHRNFSSRVLGLVLDLVKCKTLPGSILRRIISWRCGASGLHVVVVQNTQTRDLLFDFARQHSLQLDVRVLEWLHMYREPRNLAEDGQQRAEGYNIPFFLASACEVPSSLSKALKLRLLASVLGHDTIIHSTLEEAISYRQQKTLKGTHAAKGQRNLWCRSKATETTWDARSGCGFVEQVLVPKNPKKDHKCPELLTLNGCRIKENGDICGSTCPEQVLPLLGTSTPLIVQEVYTKLQQETRLLKGRMRERAGLEQEQDTLSNDLGHGEASAAPRRIDFNESTTPDVPGQTLRRSHVGSSSGVSMHETNSPQAASGAAPRTRRAEQQLQPEVPRRPRRW